MYIISKEKFREIDKIFGQLFITYLSSDFDKVSPVLNELKKIGVSYNCVEKNDIVCARNDYSANTLFAIDKCKCAILFLSASINDSKNQSLKSKLWYEVGYMASRKIKLLVFFIDIAKKDVNEFLTYTPIRQVQGTDNVSDLLQIVDKLNLAKGQYFANDDLNKYIHNRVYYMKITAMLNIYKSNITAMQEKIKDLDDSSTDEHTIVNAFLNELKCGCTIVKFGTDAALKEEFTPYLDETQPIMLDYPVKYDYNKPTLMENSNDDDVFATIKMDFIIPNHSLLGVSFKPFLAINKFSKFNCQQLINIIESNLKSKDVVASRDIVTKTVGTQNRLYFLFDLDTATLNACEENNLGKTANFIWPQ